MKKGTTFFKKVVPRKNKSFSSVHQGFLVFFLKIKKKRYHFFKKSGTKFLNLKKEPQNHLYFNQV